jgi:hypothetical protein
LFQAGLSIEYPRHRGARKTHIMSKLSGGTDLRGWFF